MAGMITRGHFRIRKSGDFSFCHSFSFIKTKLCACRQNRCVFIIYSSFTNFSRCERSDGRIAQTPRRVLMLLLLLEMFCACYVCAHTLTTRFVESIPNITKSRLYSSVVVQEYKNAYHRVRASAVRKIFIRQIYSFSFHFPKRLRG